MAPITQPTSESTQPASESLLAREFTKRITQLGMSRREFGRRTGLSRQTVHNVEVSGHTELRPSTLAAIDHGLYWRPGTTLALANGNEDALVDADALTQVDRESAYRWRIVERIQRMPLEELERMVAIMEGETLGESDLTTDQAIAAVEERIMSRLEARLALRPNNGAQAS